MDPAKQRQSGETFRRLHHVDSPLVLVNAWDAVSARLFEDAGAAAIATTSAGVAWSLGYADGQHLAPAELIQACERICRVVHVPVTADIERGYGTSPEAVSALVRGLIDVGVVGVNIEDGRESGGTQLAPRTAPLERIRALRSLSYELGAALFINARTDVYFVPWDDPFARYDEAVARARAYVEAGADGVFVPGLNDIDEIERMSQAVTRPLNIYAGYEGVPSIAALRRAGVRRVSLGCGPLQALLALGKQIATEALQEGTFTAMTQQMIASTEINRLFTR